VKLSCKKKADSDPVHSFLLSDIVRYHMLS
jgi:hypothetical protein